MATIMSVPVYASVAIRWDGRHGHVDASDLGVSAGQALHARVWDDSFDIGFLVTSSKSRENVLFTLESQSRTQDGDLLSSTYVSHGFLDGRHLRSKISSSYRPLPELVRVTVYND